MYVRAWQTFFVKRQKVNIRFCRPHGVSLKYSSLPFQRERVTGNVSRNNVAVCQQNCISKRGGGSDLAADHRLPTLDLFQQGTYKRPIFSTGNS